jgi:hypothetical protein
MSAQATPPVPAGWYPDPENPATARYWDGAAWTEHRHQPGQAAPKLRAPEGTEPNTVWIWILVLLPILGFLPLPFIPWQSYVESTMQNPTSPTGVLDSQFAIFTSPAYLASIALSFVVYAGTVVLALLDYRELTARSVPKPFHWALSFIPSYGYLVYIIGRTVVVKSRTDRGLGPLWLTIAVFVLGIVFSFVLFAQMMTGMTELMGTYSYR